jgi:hypothetical protein
MIDRLSELRAHSTLKIVPVELLGVVPIVGSGNVTRARRRVWVAEAREPRPAVLHISRKLSSFMRTQKDGFIDSGRTSSVEEEE